MRYVVAPALAGWLLLVTTCSTPPPAADAGSADSYAGAGEANQWLDVPGTESCLQVATRPTQVLAELRIVPCPTVATGCREVLVDWSSPTRPAFRVLDAEHLSSGGVLVFRRGAVGGWDETIVARADGTVEAAFRGPDEVRCYSGQAAVSESRIVLVIVRATADGSALLPPLIVTAPRRAPTEARVLREFTASETLWSPQAIEATDEVIALEMPRVWRLDNDGTATLIGIEGETHVDAVVGDAIFYSTGPEVRPMQVRVSTPAGVAPLIDLAPDDASTLRTDGRDMIWQGLAEPQPFLTWNVVEIWTAPYASAGPVARQLVRRVDATSPRPFIAMGAGRIILWETDSYAVRSLDGTLLETLPADGEGVDLNNTYSVPTEIAFGISTPRFFPGHRTFRWLAR